VARKKGGKRGGKWIQGARKRMAQKGTIGAFGKATGKKIAAGKKKGGLEAKRAVFAENMKQLAARRKGKKSAKRARK
jgi:hypothetical protein